MSSRERDREGKFRATEGERERFSRAWARLERGKLYIVNEKNDSESRGSKSISILDGLISGNTEKIPPSPVIKQLAVTVENGKKFSSMKDFLATNKGSSPIKERAGLSLFAVRLLVLCEKEDNMSEFPDEVKLYSLISLLFDAGGKFLRRKISSGSETTAATLLRDIHAAPLESFVTKVAEVIGSCKTMRDMALFWCRVDAEAKEVDMVRKRDRFWEYVDLSDDKFECKFCHRKFAGGVPRVKSHLSGIRGCGIDICTKVPDDVRVAAAEAISCPNKRAKAEACSSKTEESSPKMLVRKDDVMLDKLLAKFILLDNIDVDIVGRPLFIDFVNAVAEHGSHYKLPCHSVVKTKLVPDLEKEIGEHVANVKKSWNRTGCTLMPAIWCGKGKGRSFINIFAYSIEGMILLTTANILQGEVTSTLLRNILCSVTQEMGPSSMVQCITNSAQAEGFYEDMPIGNYPHVYQTNCVAHEIYLLLEDIYNDIVWVRKAFDQARVVVTRIHKHDGVLSLMKQFTNNWELKQCSTTKFYSNYCMLQSIMEVESELRLLVSSSEWPSFGFEKDESGKEVGEIIRSSKFWSEGKEVLHALKSVFQVLCLVHSYGATYGFLYAAVEMAHEAIRQTYETNVDKYQTLWEIFKLRQSCIIHPLHAAAAFLNPAYMCSKKFKENDAMKEGINFIVEKLVGGEEKEKFVQEMLLYRDKVPKLFTCTAMAMLKTSHPWDWWDYCGHVLPVLKKYAIQILSQPCSTSFCWQSIFSFETAQNKRRKPLMTAATDTYPYLRTNSLLMESFNTMKGKIRKPVDLEKLSELPDWPECIDEIFPHDPLNENKVPFSGGKLNCWSASARKYCESEKNLRLHFITELPLSLVKGNEIEGEGGAPINVVLVDFITGSLVQSGPSAMLKLMVTVIGGDFHEEASKNWTREFFCSNELLGRKDKMPLLTGDLSMILDKGLGTLGAVTFNDVSSWTRSGKFRLAVKTASGHSGGIRVLEGISNAFTVEDGKRADPNIYGDRLWTPEGIDMSKVLYTETVNALVDVSEHLSLKFPGERGPLRSALVESMLKMVTENMPQFLERVVDHMSSMANARKDRTGSSVEPSSMEVKKQWLSSRRHFQARNLSCVVSGSSGDAQEAACSRVNDDFTFSAGTSSITRDRTQLYDSSREMSAMVLALGQIWSSLIRRKEFAVSFRRTLVNDSDKNYALIPSLNTHALLLNILFSDPCFESSELAHKSLVSVGNPLTCQAQVCPRHLRPHPRS
ncbi:hypothetical protein ACJRO7_031461 [Eucalyptus globulus]|uniref:BED-type domain-containing protein n=1 Tax=Eucalyptus globulus TaxID=34317 RepID=A0ABD3JKB1_EUCGL